MTSTSLNTHNNAEPKVGTTPHCENACWPDQGIHVASCARKNADAVAPEPKPEPLTCWECDEPDKCLSGEVCFALNSGYPKAVPRRGHAANCNSQSIMSTGARGECTCEGAPQPGKPFMSAEADRQSFERWAKSKGRNIDHALTGEPTDYFDGRTDSEWCAWKAAQSHERGK
jgi:hypothetical protein